MPKLTSVSADLRQIVDMLGQKFQIKGRYVKSPKDRFYLKLEVEGLPDEVRRAERARLLGGLARAVGGHHDDLGRLLLAAATAVLAALPATARAQTPVGPLNGLTVVLQGLGTQITPVEANESMQVRKTCAISADSEHRATSVL